jgi:hypothetical protein
MSETFPNTQAERLARETSWVSDIMSGNTRWNRLGTVHRLYAQLGRKFVVWKYSKGVPVILDTLRVTNLSMAPSTGVSIHLSSLASAEASSTISQMPFELSAANVFAWTQAWTDVRFAPTEYAAGGASHRSLSVPFCVKVASNPKKHLVEGGAYFSSVQEFAALWPNACMTPEV